MAPITPLNSDDCEVAFAYIQWLAFATGFTANSMLSLARHPKIAKAILGLKF